MLSTIHSSNNVYIIIVTQCLLFFGSIPYEKKHKIFLPLFAPIYKKAFKIWNLYKQYAPFFILSDFFFEDLFFNKVQKITQK